MQWGCAGQTRPVCSRSGNTANREARRQIHSGSKSAASELLRRALVLLLLLLPPLPPPPPPLLLILMMMMMMMIVLLCHDIAAHGLLSGCGGG